MITTRKFLAEAKFYEGYSRFVQSIGQYETWNEAVDRVMNTHRKKYEHLLGNPEFENMLDKITKFYKERKILGSQRALQFGGEQLLKHEAKLYNCLSSVANRPSFFNEFFYFLLCGCGVGYSIQKHHVSQLPKIQHRKKNVRFYTIEDSIEGWSDSIAVLLSSFFVGGGIYQEFEGKTVYFDSSKIRPKGSKISGGFLAPGPEPLILSLSKIESLLNSRAEDGYLRPIDVYDICCHIADSVLSGGVRRSATIALFSKDDEEMMTAKTGNWFTENPQRARSNNSVMLKRNETTFEDFQSIMKFIKEYGEPGFVFVDNLEHTFNPCLEIGMYTEMNGEYGFQGCNLVEQNGELVDSEETFYEMCEAASALATLQAGYTNFRYVSDITKKIFEREALLGVSLTGWANKPNILLVPEVMQRGAEIVKRTNAKVAKLIGINPAARTTCVKPAGNASTLLGTAPATQGEHSSRYFRITQMNKLSSVAKAMVDTNPYMVEESIWSSTKSDYVIYWPITASKGSILKKDLNGVKFLEMVKSIQQNWVIPGTNENLCVDKTIRHNVSNTTLVNPDEWDEVMKYVFDNKEYFTGVSFIAASGDKDYAQAPYTEVKTASEIVKLYGDGAMFASGLIVDSNKGFRDLWEACYIARFNGQECGEMKDIQSDWVRRFEKFSNNFFDGDQSKAEYCLKDVHLLHKWNKISKNLVEFDFRNYLKEQTLIDVDTMGAAVCSPTQGCEI